jgi:hypothetical protein
MYSYKRLTNGGPYSHNGASETMLCNDTLLPLAYWCRENDYLIIGEMTVCVTLPVDAVRALAWPGRRGIHRTNFLPHRANHLDTLLHARNQMHVTKLSPSK